MTLPLLIGGLTGCSTTNSPESKVEVPSYLRGYEELYAENPREAAKQWFDDADFGLFIHYGLYSLAEGYWGDIHSKPAEWVQLRAKVPVKEYEKLADRFTAENFDADFITDLALDAGVKYINITTQPYAWGYDRDNDVGHKTPDEVMEMLAHTKAMNANLLLNIGPLPDGTVFPDDVTCLREVGKRLKK